jgi:hypoxanthine phosphoribosyltransferase
MPATCTVSSPEGITRRGGSPSFSHPSEWRFARILDFYRIRWEYEPHTYPIAWAPDGTVSESFTPDFWLPDQGVYVEVTMLRQSLVTKKNRKLRRFRELYPERSITLLYRADLEGLRTRYDRPVSRARPRFHALLT